MGSGSSARPYYDSSYSNELVPPARQSQQLTNPDGLSLLSPIPEDSTNRAGEKFHVPYPADPTMLRIPYLTRYPFQDYRFAKKVGNGRFGSVVYKAIKLHEYIKTNERYAVKEIMTQEIKAIEYDDLRYEINILSQLTHENIVQYKEVYEPTTSQNAKMYIVIEYLRGGELLTALVNDGKYTFHDTLFYLQQVASAIDYLKRHGIVHGNIIPENIIVQDKFNGESRKDNVIKLVGFDYAECFSPNNNHRDSLSTLAVHSRKRPIQKVAKDPKFCPPEYRDEQQDDSRDHSSTTHKKTMLESASLPSFLTHSLGSNQVPQKTLDNYRPAVDVWGFAAIFYFLLTGTMPFIEVLHYWEKPQKKLSFREKVWDMFDDSAREFFIKALHHDPTQRMKAEEIKKNPWFSRDVSNLRENDIDLTTNIQDLRYFQMERSRCYSMIIASKPVSFRRAARFQDDQVSPTFMEVSY